jgi:PAS domain S-box-containing protein
MAKNTESEISNPQSLRVLMVEDSEDDALLEIRELKKGGYNPVYERVETAAAMKKALKEKQWDIILCDYKLPKFNAPSAIAVLKETNIDIPLIIVSGAIGEETAVECMRLGAHDYIMKGNLSRLCVAIARELDEANSRNKRKQAEEALRQSEEKYRNLVERANDGICFVQEGILRYTNARLAQIGGYSVEELTGKPFTDFFTPEEVPKALDRYKRRMAGKDVAPVYETALKHNDGSRVDIEINAGVITYEGKPADLALVRDITERKRAEEELQQGFKRMRKALRVTVQSISMIVEMKDPYTSGHQQRVSDLARSIATEMGLSADRRDFLRTASAIHDIGKISVPSEILSKPTKLTDLEFSLIKTHVRAGYDILKDIEFPWPVADVVLQHHERMDGSGYPQGLKGDDILLEARILAVADVVEAIASHRPYRPELGIDFALEEISGNKGILYDADAVDACLKLFREKGYTLVLEKS